MRKLVLLPLLFVITIASFAQGPNWKMVEGKISTPWASQVDANKPLPEYPRPQFVRDAWMNLNGLWDYAIAPTTQHTIAAYQGKILVPFAAESALSGVGKTVGKDNQLWYRRTFTLPQTFNGKNTLLHFGAADWQCEVFVNGKKAGEHKGGYDPFSFDITALLNKSASQEIVVKVWDPSDEGPQPRGKQVKNPNSIWYTPVTGIWQTVWLEAVPKTFIQSAKYFPDIDNQNISIVADVKNFQPGDKLVLVVSDGSQKMEQATTNAQMKLPIANVKLWSPSSPFLYDLNIRVVRNNKVVDEVKSYFAMRKISVGTDMNGIKRMMLNNQFLFQYGPLDQGWWPDGLYTAPTDEALKFDIEKTKAMGFNMIRKHVKVEPARWYYHCDKLGMLVWQDMPSGDMGNRWDSRPGIIGLATERDRSPESETIFKTEWEEIMNDNFNSPSIVVWVPFNEAWGQFKTTEIVNWTVSKDTTRLVNAASGGNFFPVGHIIDLHNYPDPCMPSPQLYGEQIIVLGEYGGLGLPVEGHTWQEKNNWGYQSFPDKEELLKKYESFIDRFPELIKKGLSAAVYTQTTDVEIEVNGLMTYDRKVVKMPEERLKDAHQKMYDKDLVIFRK
jgi:beta-galactosidase/beta-glucuronidase